MKRTSHFAIVVIGLFLVCSSAYGQWWPGIPIDGVSRGIQFINDIRNFIYHRETESECIGGTYHDVTYAYAFGIKGPIVVNDVDTGFPCACSAVTGMARPAVGTSHALRPRAEDNCDSPDAYDNSLADTVDYDELTSLLGGATGPDPFVKAPPRPSITPMGASLWLDRNPAAASRPHPDATTTGAFPFTLPYRELSAAPLLVGALPNVNAVCLSAVNPTSWETAHTDNQVIRFNMCTGQRVATINVAQLPLEIRVTPDGTEALVTHFSGAVSFISSSSNTVSAVLPLPGNFTPSGLAISPDGRYALVTNLEPAAGGGAALGVIDVAGRTMTSTITLDTDYPRSVYLSPDATLAWVVFPFNNLVEVIDLLTGTVVQRFTFVQPESVAFNATGTVAYVAEGGGVQVIDTKTYALQTFVTTGAASGDLLVTPDGAYLVVNNSGSQSVSVIDTRTLAVSTQSVSGAPRGIIAVPLQ